MFPHAYTGHVCILAQTHENKAVLFSESYNLIPLLMMAASVTWLKWFLLGFSMLKSQSLFLAYNLHFQEGILRFVFSRATPVACGGSQARG